MRGFRVGDRVMVNRARSELKQGLVGRRGTVMWFYVDGESMAIRLDADLSDDRGLTVGFHPDELGHLSILDRVAEAAL